MALPCQKCKKNFVSKITCCCCKIVYHASCELLDPDDPKKCYKDEFAQLCHVPGIKWFCIKCESKCDNKNQTMKTLTDSLVDTINSNFKALSEKLNENVSKKQEEKQLTLM